MLTYGMTLEECAKNKKRSPVLFFFRSGESQALVELKGLINSMTVYESDKRPDMMAVCDAFKNMM